MPVPGYPGKNNKIPCPGTPGADPRNAIKTAFRLRPRKRTRSTRDDMRDVLWDRNPTPGTAGTRVRSPVREPGYMYPGTRGPGYYLIGIPTR
eukprot:1475046-Rhodomonas_salina.2